MADEPSESVAQATHAHECNGAREGSPCNSLTESDAASIDGATERLCQPTTIPSGRTDLGLDSAQASALTEPPSASADSPDSAARPVSSALLRVVPTTPGSDHPGGVRHEVSYRWNGEAAGIPAHAPGGVRPAAAATRDNRCTNERAKPATGQLLGSGYRRVRTLRAERRVDNLGLGITCTSPPGGGSKRACSPGSTEQGCNGGMEAQTVSEKHGLNSADTNTLTWVLHAIVQRRPTAHFRARVLLLSLGSHTHTRESEGASLASKLVGGFVCKSRILSYGLS